MALKNPKTTFLGVGTILAGLATFFVTKDLTTIGDALVQGLPYVLAGFGLIKASDGDM